MIFAAKKEKSILEKAREAAQKKLRSNKKKRARSRAKKIICSANYDSCRTLSPAAVQLRKLVAEGEISPAEVPPAEGREALLREPPAPRVTSGMQPKLS